jgi:hypothetical protein
LPGADFHAYFGGLGKNVSSFCIVRRMNPR